MTHYRVLGIGNARLQFGETLIRKSWSGLSLFTVCHHNKTHESIFKSPHQVHGSRGQISVASEKRNNSRPYKLFKAITSKVNKSFGLRNYCTHGYLDMKFATNCAPLYVWRLH